MRSSLPRLLLIAGLVASCAPHPGVIVETARPIAAPPTTTPVTTAPSTTPSTVTPPSTPITIEPPDTTIPAGLDGEVLADIELADVVDVGPSKPDRDHDAFVAAAVSDIEAWWSERFPEVYGGAFRPLEGGVIVGYPERRDDVPGCPDGTTAYEDLQQYVAFYCPFGDFMAYDDGDGPDSLLVPLADQFGSAVLGVVLAHEYGHAIQQQVGAFDIAYPTIVTEQQADCFAGAWTGHVYRGGSDLLRLGDRDIRAGLLAMIEVRDPVGADQYALDGHGSAFDRVGAFQVGFDEGPARCAELLDEPLPLMPNQFRGFDDEVMGGNAPYHCTELLDAGYSQEAVDACEPAPSFLARDLNHFWRTELGAVFEDITVRAVQDADEISCRDPRVLTSELVVCPASREVWYLEPEVLSLYRDFGDFTLGYLYGIGWAEIVFDDVGSDLVDEDRALAADCLVGAWVADITPDATGAITRDRDEDGDGQSDAIISSPGDLDEAIQMAIIEGDPSATTDDVGSAFEKIASFRAGVLGGIDACGL